MSSPEVILLDNSFFPSYIESLESGAHIRFAVQSHHPGGAFHNTIPNLLRFIERAPNSQAAFCQDVCIDHCRAHVRMAEQFLDRSDIVALFEESGSERVAKGMAASVLCDP